MTHVRAAPYYPQSKGKIERWHKSLKGECIRPGTPLPLADARKLAEARRKRSLANKPVDAKVLVWRQPISEIAAVPCAV